MHENFGEARTAVLVGPGKRDLRLDLLRGIGQWMVFVDHIPYNFSELVHPPQLRLQ